MVFSRRTAAPEHKVLSNGDLDDAISYLASTSDRWFDGTAESLQTRLSHVNRVQQINASLMQVAIGRGEDIERFARVKDAMSKVASELRDGLLASEASYDEPELPSFSVNAAKGEWENE